MSTSRREERQPRPSGAKQPPPFGLDSFLSGWHGSQSTQVELLPMLAERGFVPTDTNRLPLDRRRIHPIPPPPRRVVRPQDRSTPTFLQPRKGGMGRASSTSALHARASSAMLFGDEGEMSEAEATERVNERMLQKLSLMQHDLEKRNVTTRQKLDAHGIFDPNVNRVRAATMCSAGLHKSASLDALRQRATHEIKEGIPFVDTRQQAGPSTLKSKLDQLSLQIERELELARASNSTSPTRMSDGAQNNSLQHRLSRKGSMRARTRSGDIASDPSTSHGSSPQRKRSVAAPEGGSFRRGSTRALLQ